MLDYVAGILRDLFLDKDEHLYTIWAASFTCFSNSCKYDFIEVSQLEVTFLCPHLLCHLSNACVQR